ncbi:MAG TPA: dual specificity protein phosphatase [Chloroflexota bacterium]
MTEHRLSRRRPLGPHTAIGYVVDEGLRFVRKGFARVAELAPTRLNFSWITSDLAVGGAFHKRDGERLHKMGIGAVVDCREEASDDERELARFGIAFLRLPTPDATTLTQDSLTQGVSWVRDQLESGRKVYIHCTHGVGRAPELGACVLVTQGYDAEDALELVKARRWQASPNAEQIEGLVRFAEQRAQ